MCTNDFPPYTNNSSTLDKLAIKRLLRLIFFFMTKQDPVYKHREYRFFIVLFYFFLLFCFTFLSSSLMFVFVFVLLSCHSLSPVSHIHNPFIGASLIAYGALLPTVYLIVSFQEAYRIFYKRARLSWKSGRVRAVCVYPDTPRQSVENEEDSVT